MSIAIKRIEEEAIFRAAEITQSIQDSRWPLSFQAYVDIYHEIGWTRPASLWKWVWVMLKAREPGVTLSCVPDDKMSLISSLKLNLVMAFTISDDVADEVRCDQLMAGILNIRLERDELPLDCAEPRSEDPMVRLIEDILDDTVAMLSKQPNWERMRDAFFFDLRQVWNSSHHAFLMGKHPELINYEESRMYNAHGMMFFIFSVIDVICSESFDFNELPQLRSVVHHAQRMGRISNWVSTWEREIAVGDITSGLVSMLVSRGVVTVDELWEMSETATTSRMIEIARKALVHETMYEEWEKLREEVLGYACQTTSFSIHDYLDGVEMAMCYYLACKKLV